MNQYEVRPSGKGWAVDKYEFGSYTFYAKFSSKKSALAYINNKTNGGANGNA